MLYDVNCHQGAHSGQHPPLTVSFNREIFNYVAEYFFVTNFRVSLWNKILQVSFQPNFTIGLDSSRKTLVQSRGPYELLCEARFLSDLDENPEISNVKFQYAKK